MNLPGAGRTLLVTGAAGFVGGHVTDAAARAGWRVRSLVRTQGGLRRLQHSNEAVLGDVRDSGVVARAVDGVDAVVHLAGRVTGVSPAEMESVNVVGTAVLCAALARLAPRARLVYASSAAAGGPSAHGHPRSESDLPRPITDYGRSKLAAERVVERSGLSWVCLRPPLVLGERAHGLEALVTLARLGIAPVLSGVEPPISVIDVRDLATYCVRALDLADGRECLHVAASRPTTFSGLVAVMGALLGHRVRPVPLPRLALAAAACLASRCGRRSRRAAALGDRLDVLLADAWVLDVRRAERVLGACEEPDVRRALAAMLVVRHPG